MGAYAKTSQLPSARTSIDRNSMKKDLTIRQILLIALVLGTTIVVSCKKGDRTQSTMATAAPTFPMPPRSLANATERADYVLDNVWNGIAGIDTLTFRDSGEREQFLVNYFGFGALASERARRASMSKLFELATPAMDSVILSIAGRYFDTPESPLFNQAYFIETYEEADKLGILDYAQQLKLEDRRSLYQKNQEGEAAEDFEYTLANGQTSTLYKTSPGKKLLLMFYDPECNACKDVLEFLSHSEPIQALLGSEVSWLCVYVDQDVETWRKSLSHLPSYAITGRDATGMVTDQSLYDLRVLPVLYLLDEHKRVIIRDAYPQEVESYFAALQEAKP